MCDSLFTAISCTFFLLVSAEECSQSIQARRATFYAPQGGTLSLSCVVQHCGDTWTGNWIWKNSTEEKTVENSDRHNLTNVTVSANETRLLLHFLTVSQLDEGSYRCTVTWSQGNTDLGHWMYVKAAPSGRNLLHRGLVCAGAFVCLPIILGLVRCLSSEVKPQPLPRTCSRYIAPPHPQQPETEVGECLVSRQDVCYSALNVIFFTQLVSNIPFSWCM
uniref:uncharacterized protein LOC109952228 isoform X1 n=1 Tax=Monopterus albus TaxID=43700 RepID=UPI0009B3847F|nr:uncharacterized protein LOC109952228 isoform X1 [Monopterus albus]XP_020443046.1 uncharacterized protein LOC109952351 isoform X1 [Monopterus albus]